MNLNCFKCNQPLIVSYDLGENYNILLDNIYNDCKCKSYPEQYVLINRGKLSDTKS